MYLRQHSIVRTFRNKNCGRHSARVARRDGRTVGRAEGGWAFHPRYMEGRTDLASSAKTDRKRRRRKKTAADEEARVECERLAREAKEEREFAESQQMLTKGWMV